MLKKLFILPFIWSIVLLAQITVDLDWNFTVSTWDVTPFKTMLWNLVQSLFSILWQNWAWILGWIIALSLIWIIIWKFAWRHH